MIQKTILVHGYYSLLHIFCFFVLIVDSEYILKVKTQRMNCCIIITHAQSERTKYDTIEIVSIWLDLHERGE